MRLLMGVAMGLWMREIMLIMLVILLSFEGYGGDRSAVLTVSSSLGILIHAVYSYLRNAKGRKALISELESITIRIPLNRRLGIGELALADPYFEDAEKLKRQWMEFRGSAGDPASVRLPDSRAFFSHNSLCRQDPGLRMARLMPGTLTGLGILGTFVGLVLGLWQMDLESTETLQASIHTLTSGMKTAFITSIAGVLCSIGYAFFDQRLDNRLINALEDFHNALSTLIPPTTEGAILDGLLATQKQQLAELQTFTTDRLPSMLAQEFGEVMSQTLTPHMQRTTDLFQNLVDGSAEIQVQGMRQMAEDFSSSLNQATRDQLETFGQLIGELTEWQKQVHGELMVLVNQLIIGAEEQQKSTALSLELADRIQGHVPAFESLRDTVSTLSEDMSQSAVAFSDIASNVIDVHENTAEIAKLQDTMEEQMSRLVREISESASMQQHSLDTSLELVDKMQGQARVFRDIEEALIVLDRSISQSTTSFSSVANGMTELHGEFGQSMRISLEQMVTLRESQEQYRELLSDSLSHVTGLQEAWAHSIGELREFEAQFSASIQTFTDQLHQGLQYTFERFDTSLHDVTIRLQSLISSMSDSVENIPDEMDRATEALGELRHVVEKAVLDAGQALPVTFEQFDDVLSEAVTRLQLLLDTMTNTVQYLPEEMDKTTIALLELQGIAESAVSHFGQPKSDATCDENEQQK